MAVNWIPGIEENCGADLDFRQGDKALQKKV